MSQKNNAGGPTAGQSDKTPDNGQGGGKGKPNKIRLVVVVNGDPVDVEANLNAPLQTVVNKALDESENQGQPPENWELRTEGGVILDTTQKVSTFGFVDGTVLVLSLKAGALG
jgi:hypothetical protein